MGKSILASILLVLAVNAYAGRQDPSRQNPSVQDPARQAEALFDRGEYGQGFALLNKALRTRAISPLQRADAMMTLAEFYEEKIGNPEGALRQYRRVLQVDLPAGHLLKARAQQNAARLVSLAKEYSRQDALLEDLRHASQRLEEQAEAAEAEFGRQNPLTRTFPIASDRGEDEEKLKSRITSLQDFIKANPQYYRLPEAYYFLAMSYKFLGQNGRAYRLLGKCLELSPCIDFYLPAGVQSEIVRARWLVSTVNRAAWDVLGVLLVLTALVFYTARPWRWVKPLHLVFGLAGLVLWVIVFSLSLIYLAHRFEVDPKAVAEITIRLPAFVSAAPGSPGSGVATRLLLYGLLGVFGVYLFSIAAGRLRLKWLAFVLNPFFGLLLLTCLGVVFYMRHCQYKGTFNSQSHSLLHYPAGNLYFIQKEPEPYILTNPGAYRNLGVRYVEDADFKEWIIRHCPFDPGVLEANLKDPE